MYANEINEIKIGDRRFRILGTMQKLDCENCSFFNPDEPWCTHEDLCTSIAKFNNGFSVVFTEIDKSNESLELPK